MVSFIHIADKNDQSSIKRSGIKVAKESRVVHAVPVIPNFSTTHQWAREMKGRGAKALICVQFKIPDDETVWIGRYNEKKLEMAASEAAGVFLAHTGPVGFEVLIHRKIMPKEITRIYAAPRVTGWRYHPESKGKKPCSCDFCSRGAIQRRRKNKDGDQ
jgi:hypothetical protein